MSTVDSIFSMVIINNCMSLFESTLLSFCKPHSKLDLPSRRHGSRERLYIYIVLVLVPRVDSDNNNNNNNNDRVETR